MKLKKVKADAIIHDDACHFEAHVHRHQGIKKRFRTIKHFIVDEFHRCNHKCKKCKLTPSEKRRFKGVRTNMSEVFNSWVRRKNFTCTIVCGPVVTNFGCMRPFSFGTRISGKCQRIVCAGPPLWPANVPLQDSNFRNSFPKCLCHAKLPLEKICETSTKTPKNQKNLEKTKKNKKNNKPKKPTPWRKGFGFFWFSRGFFGFWLLTGIFWFLGSFGFWGVLLLVLVVDWVWQVLWLTRMLIGNLCAYHPLRSLWA